MIKIIQPPTSEPMTFEEAVMHLRLTPVEGDDSPTTLIYPEEDEVRRLITEARQHCEQYLMRALAPQTVEYAVECFPMNGVIELPFGPVNNVTSIYYADGEGFSVPLDAADYVLNDYVNPPTICRGPTVTWPTVQTANPVAVRIRYETGYTAGGESPTFTQIPDPIKRAMKLLIGFWFENRDVAPWGDVAAAVDALLIPYQLRKSMA